MNILLVGGSCSLMDSMILKLRKEGHRVFVLTGDKYKHHKYEKVFERYDFPYDSENLGEIIESVNPDATILMGTFDTNYVCRDVGQETVHFISHLTNFLVAYSVLKRGKVIFLSSDEVHSGNHVNDIEETEPTSGFGIWADCLSQAEEICENFRKNRGLDLVVLRLDHLYHIPKEKKDVDNICADMCVEALKEGHIKVDIDHKFSLLYENDAVEYMYQVIRRKEHEKNLYQLSSNDIVSEIELAGMISEYMEDDINIITASNEKGRCVLSGNQFEREYGVHAFGDLKKNIKKMVLYIKNIGMYSSKGMN